MHRPRAPQRTLAHVATALGVFALVAVLTSSPFDRVLQSTEANGAVAAPSTAAEPPNLESPITRRLADAGSSSVSSRGGQRLAQTASPAADNVDSPTPTATATTAATPMIALERLAKPSATATKTPSATPTLPPTATPTRAPTAVPPEAPAAAPRVGLQVGHWKNSELPAELASLRGSTGAAGNGWREVDVNLDVAQRAAALLQKQNVLVDLIPATVPIRYKADAFVAIHGDANSNTSLSGYKLARSSRSRIPAKDDALLNAISTEYASATGLHSHPATITLAMTSYYAFSQGLQYAVDPSTPSVILELGFLTTPSDRKLLMEQPDRAAEGIANGVLSFLGRR